jgi:hypothetical protein
MPLRFNEKQRMHFAASVTGSEEEKITCVTNICLQATVHIIRQ